MSRRNLLLLAGLSVMGLAFHMPVASAKAPRVACMAAHRASVSPRCRSVFAARPLLHHHSRTGWRPVIPPFDQAEAEAEVHEIAPYRTYPYYPLYPDFAPYPYAW